jgi:Zn finger protein HypA/HybF involved in hydrogenase expression
MDQLEAQHREERRRLEEAAARAARDSELHEKQLLEGIPPSTSECWQAATDLPLNVLASSCPMCTRKPQKLQHVLGSPALFLKRVQVFQCQATDVTTYPWLKPLQRHACMCPNGRSAAFTAIANMKLIPHNAAGTQ